MAEYINIFPTTLARYSYPKHAEFKEQAKFLLDNTSEFREYSNGVHFFEHSLALLDQLGLEEFKLWVIEQANDYAHNLLKIDTDMILAGSWANLTNQGYKQHIHNHGNSYLSATYYLNYNPEHHSAIDFYNNVESRAGLPYLYYKPREFNQHNGVAFRLSDLKEGELIIWPSHLEHGFEPNSGDHRVSIAMNFLPAQISNGRYRLRITKE
jgi:uncharacterized protein (TIGR02466 family)